MARFVSGMRVETTILLVLLEHDQSLSSANIYWQKPQPGFQNRIKVSLAEKFADPTVLAVEFRGKR